MRPTTRPSTGAAAAALSREGLDRRTAARDMSVLGFAELTSLVTAETARHAPLRQLGLDPRDGSPVLYNEARAERPDGSQCPVCLAQTCPAIDVAEHDDHNDDHNDGGDASWLTPNLYPHVFPWPEPDCPVRGLHLVQWSSRHHARRWEDDAPLARALLRQLARAEELLLHGAPDNYPDTDNGHHGWVALVKNQGPGSGASLEHDHQQLMLTSVAPRSSRLATGIAASLWENAQAELLVDRVDDQAITVVAPYMRRPLHAFVVPSTGDQGYLHHLPTETRDAMAEAVCRLIGAVGRAMADVGQLPTWNLVCLTGPGCGPVFELCPATQPLGGYEHMGLISCEETPARSAGRLRDAQRWKTGR